MQGGQTAAGDEPGRGFTHQRGGYTVGDDTRFERYKQTIRGLSDRIVQAQRPIRILDSIKWDASIQAAFFANDCREPPPVGPDYYARRPLPFDPAQVRLEFEDIAHDVRRNLGQFNPLAKIMERMCREYCDVVRLIEARGQPEFSKISQQLYGSSSDAFHAGDPSWPTWRCCSPTRWPTRAGT